MLLGLDMTCPIPETSDLRSQEIIVNCCNLHYIFSINGFSAITARHIIITAYQIEHVNDDRP